ncbi:MAG: Zeta toxin family protein, partial [Acidobacteria bacterium]
ALAVNEFVNADVIARGLSAFDPESAAIAAGRVMLTRLHELAAQRVLCIRDDAGEPFVGALAAWTQGVGIRDSPSLPLVAIGYFALDRVAERVRAGGHDVPAETIRRRYRVGLRNFFQLYEPLVSGWVVYDSSGPRPRLIAERLAPEAPRVYDGEVWTAITHQGKS